jgi:glycosyltransferase involved in cell wall biosynthesis
MYDLSILIPARNEMFLSKTIEDILEHAEGNTEIIVVLDGQWADPVIIQNPKVTVIYHAESIGQRAACNEAAKLAKGKYVMKVDAHCAFDQGFDVKLMSDMQDDWTVVPTMRNLWAFDWKCKKCGKRTYQGPTPTKCDNCGTVGRFVRRMVWKAKTNPQSNSYCFDPTPHFQYFKEFNNRPEGMGDLTETMSLQGSCFMLTKEKWFELTICDEGFGSWGSQGIEVSVKTWLSGGKVMVNHKTWYGHMFRTQGGDFSFPYPISNKQVDRAKFKAKELFFSGKFEKQIYPLSWLVKKFWTVPGWTDEDLKNLEISEKL